MEEEINNPDQQSGTRLAKRMSELGICSRREADEYILNGEVYVNGELVKQKGFRVIESDIITVSRQASAQQEEKVTIILHKPLGFVSGQAEKGYEDAISLIQPQSHWDAATSEIKFDVSHKKNLAVAGRLDIDSTGLLIFTQNGVIARQLIGDFSKIEKEYLVRVEGKIIPNGLALLNHGLLLDGEKLREAKVVWQNDDQLNFKLKQGKKRQIRRMCELVGLKVVGLKRVRIGQICLNDLPLGKWRYLRPNEAF